MKLIINGREYEAEVTSGKVKIGDKSFDVSVDSSSSPAVVKVGDKTMKVDVQGNCVIVDGTSYLLEVPAAPAVAAPKTATAAKKAAPAPAAAQAPVAGDAVRAGMPGQVVGVRVKEGESVTADTVVVVIEAMKMENEIRAGKAGVIKSVPVKVGSSVNQGDILVVLD